MDTDSIAYPGKQVLLIKAPKEVKDSLLSFPAFFSDLHKLISSKGELVEHERTISFEVYLQENYFEYRIVASRKLTPIIIPLLYTKFNELEISGAELGEPRMTEPYRIVQFGLKRSRYFPLLISCFPHSDLLKLY